MSSSRRVVNVSVVIAVILLAVGVLVIRYWPLKSPVDRLVGGDRSAFWQLLRRNGIILKPELPLEPGVPLELTATMPTDDYRIRAWKLRGGTLGEVILTLVDYKAGGLGGRGYTIVFNKDGHCLFWSRDDHHLSPDPQCAVTYLTGSEAPEVIVSFCNDTDKQRKMASGFGWRLQVFRLGLERGRKLLDVGYTSINETSAYVGGTSKDLVMVDPGIIFNNQGEGLPTLVLEECMSRGNIVDFVWNAQRESFEWKGKPSSLWKALEPLSAFTTN